MVEFGLEAVQGVAAALQCQRAQRLSNGPHHRRGQRLADDAAYVVGLEDLVAQCDGLHDALLSFEG